MLRPKRERFVNQRSSNESAALRLIAAERPEEIYPILLEEIVFLGFPRAAVLDVDFDSGEIKPAASLNFDNASLQKLHTSLWASEEPLVASLVGLQPVILPDGVARPGAIYGYPMIFRSQTRCWEAERDRRNDCLAVQNYDPKRKLQIQQQVCSACGMRSYISMIVGQLGRSTGQTHLRQFRHLVDRANRHLSRLFKVEHYYNRMRDMEMTISRMTTVMESMADPVILTDNQHRVIIQNRAAERFFRVPEGISEGGKRAVEFNNLLFSAALSSMVVSASDSSRDLTLVDVMEGEEVLFEAVCAPTYVGQARTGMVTVMRDVTDLRRADQEVRANLEKLRAAEEVVRQDRDRLNLVIENVGDPIVVADNSAKIVLLDPLAKELFGAGGSRDPQVAKNEAKLDAYLTAFTFSFLDRQNKALHLYSPANHSDIEYAARSGKIYDARGQVAYTVTVLRDFSTWKRLEQLQMERRMLEMEKFAATGKLAGTIAHEINNPMEAIKNAIYLLRTRLDPASQPIYEALKSETERVTRIVRQMLGLYRNTGQLGNFDLNSIVEDTLTLFARPLVKAGITVEKRMGELPAVKGSADQFRQLLSNLVVNAQDSMANGGTLTVATRYTKSARSGYGHVSLMVVDTGSGIPKEIRNTMFEPFVSTKGEKGTGLGLWIVKGIVEGHSGKILVRSSVGRGTVFKLVFPVSHA
ncbi:MAG TPA: ATP-binding protein [Terriglobales bacterium]